MSSLGGRHRREAVRSLDDYDSPLGSDDHTASGSKNATITIAPSLQIARQLPPPLPPKPAYMRSDAIVSSVQPPSLPPKPDAVRAERITEDLIPTRPRPNSFAETDELPGDSASTLFPLPPPTRPLPTPPRSDKKPSYGEEGSWVPSNLDDRSQVDQQFPPDPTITSDGEPIRIPLGKDNFFDDVPSLSDTPNMMLPLPLPPYSPCDHRLALQFQPLQLSESKDEDEKEQFVQLSTEGAEDMHIGAIVLSRDRTGDNSVTLPTRSAPTRWRLYKGWEPGGEAWTVLHEYLTNTTLKAHGRNRALQLLTGYVVSACLEGIDAGLGLLTEIVKRMRGAERSERDGSIFTLLLNVAAHCSFVQRVSWGVVEEVTKTVFSDVVEQMYGRQDDDVMWERALRCYLFLLESSEKRPSDDISSKCLAALALHVGDMTHADVDYVLITQGLCPRLRQGKEDLPSGAKIDFDCLKEIGGLGTVLILFANTASISARKSLFDIIYTIATLKYLEDTQQDDFSTLQEHILSFRALHHSYEMSFMYVHVFRVGTWQNFVMDTVRLLLMDPLTTSVQDALTGKHSEVDANGGEGVLQERAESFSLSETRYSGTVGRAIRSSGSAYLTSIQSLIKFLDRNFCLHVLSNIERMASQNSEAMGQREMMHYAKEWRILIDIESLIQQFIFGRGKGYKRQLSHVLTQLHIAVVDMTSGRNSMKYILRLIEVVIEFFTMQSAYSRLPSAVGRKTIDSWSTAFLIGEVKAPYALLKLADPSIFRLLLLGSQFKFPVRRLSEARQCLIEFLGGDKEHVEMVRSFMNDDDPAVAYRASEIVSKYADINLQPQTPTRLLKNDC